MNSKLEYNYKKYIYNNFIKTNVSKVAFTVSWSSCLVSSVFWLSDDTVEVPLQGLQQKGPHLKVWKECKKQDKQKCEKELKGRFVNHSISIQLT